MNFVRNLAQRPDHFRVTGMADQNEIVSLGIVAVDFVVHFNDQGAGRIDHVQTTPIGLLPYRLGDPVGAEDDDGTLGHFTELFHEYRTLVAQRVDDVTAMDDFVADINRGPVLLERQIDDVDRAVDPGAESTWVREINLHTGHLSLFTYASNTLRDSHQSRQQNCPPGRHAVFPAPARGSLTARPLPRTLGPPIMSGAAAKKILIVEDERDILQLVKLYLEKEGFRTVTATTGAEGLKRANDDTPDLIVLDLMLPETDGLELCADDYVTKPFSPKALVARVKALFRRLDRSQQEHQTVYRYGHLSMDLARHEVTVRGKDVPLTAKEFGLLEHLLRNPGRVLTREVLLNTVWGYDYFGTTRTVDVHVRRLKQKIPLLDEAMLSVKSLGYKLKDASGDA